MTTQLIAPITEGQKRQYKRFIEDTAERTLEKINFGKEGFQKLIESGDKLHKHITSGIREIIASSRFANEEVESSFGYISGYKKPKSIAEQVNQLRELFPGIGSAKESIASREFTDGAEGWFAIPRWNKIAPTYGEAIYKILQKISETRDYESEYYEEKLSSKFLRQLSSTEEAFRKLGEQQKGCDILIVPAQFGFYYRGRSSRRSREIFGVSEFGLSAFAVAVMILTHPERLMNENDLWIECPGDEYSSESNNDFSSVPVFIFSGGKIKFDTHGFGNVYDFYGSSSGFLF